MQKSSEFDFRLEGVQKIKGEISRNRQQSVEQMALNLQKLAYLLRMFYNLQRILDMRT